MLRIRNALSAILLVCVCVSITLAQAATSAKRLPPTAAKKAACKKEANAQNLHFDARLDFMYECLRPKKPS
jgi:hypothetical protein